MVRAVRYNVKLRDFLRSVRVDYQFKGVIIHHTEDLLSKTGKDLNLCWIQMGVFGAPYDIIINVDGTVDLTPLWIYAQSASQYKENIDVNSLFNYKYHYLSKAGVTDWQNKYVIHVAFIGNFNVQTPSWAQLRAGQKVLQKIKKKLENIEIKYCDESISRVCPGKNFFKKQDLERDME